MNTKSLIRFTAVAALFLMLPQVASAHPGHDHGTGFGAGVRHPFSGIDHILAMIAVGLLAAQRGGRSIWILPCTFVGLMIAGGFLALAGVPLPLVEQGIMASVLVLGVLIAMAANWAMPAVMGIVGLFAIFHGYAHVTEMNAGNSPAAYALGFVLATSTLHVIGIGIGLAAKQLLSPRWTRFVGGAIATCGVLLFAHVL